MGKSARWLAACFTLVVSALSIQAQTAKEKPPSAVRLFPFHEGGKDGKWGYISRHGEVVVPAGFIYALDFSDGLAEVQTAKGIGFIDAQGKMVFTLPEELRQVDWILPFSDGLAAFSVKGKCGYFNRQGKVVVEAKYDDVEKFSHGLAAVNSGAKSIGRPRPSIKEGGKWGFIDRTGRLVIPLQFDWVGRGGLFRGPRPRQACQ
jgi:hypothetical protein